MFKEVIATNILIATRKIIKWTAYFMAFVFCVKTDCLLREGVFNLIFFYF